MTNIKIFTSVIAILIVGMIATVLVRSNIAPAGPGKYDTFAQCLKDKEVTFYGAFWCSHCQAQKKLFGSSVKLLPYVECSTADGNAQTQICIDKKVESYPTWEFANSFTLESTILPHQCTSDDIVKACRDSYKANLSSWFINGTIIFNNTPPVKKENSYTFAPLSRITGEVPLETLSDATSCFLENSSPEPAQAGGNSPAQ